ncbi:hypothetical protein LZ31DRAFT_336193 [Colletotrichum somersetense]|nr:hypothetical protein LZ31DRAFT_336193 [Colletotrichum somersetense]
MTDLIPRLAWIGGHPAGPTPPGRDIGPIHNQPSTFSSSVPVAPVFSPLPQVLTGQTAGSPRGSLALEKSWGTPVPGIPLSGPSDTPADRTTFQHGFESQAVGRWGNEGGLISAVCRPRDAE